MSTNQQEALASLKVLALIAKADGKLQEEEQIALTEAFKQLQPPPEGVTLESLLAVDEQIDQVLAQITTPEAQAAVYEAAYTMAKLGGTTPSEQQLLDTIRATFQLKEEVKYLESISVEQLQKISLADQVEPVTDTAQRDREIRDLILNCSIKTAILGLNPFPRLHLLPILAAYVQTFQMMRDIGAKWGHPKDQDALAIFGNISGGFGAFAAVFAARAMVSRIGRFVPFVGSSAAASFWFTQTWGMGQATNQFYARGRQMDAAALKKFFREAKKEGEAGYKAHAEAIAARQKATEPQIKALSENVKAGKITQQEYQVKMQEILSESNSLLSLQNKSEAIKNSPSNPEITLFSSRGKGVVEETITPEKPGRVRYQATSWPARLYHDAPVTLLPKDPVYVVGRQGLTLLVVPASDKVS